MFAPDSISTPHQPAQPANEPAVSKHTETAGATEHAATPDKSEKKDSPEKAQKIEQQSEAVANEAVPAQDEPAENADATADDVEAQIDSIIPVDTVPVQQTVITVAEPPAWENGLEPIERPGHTGHNQGVITIIVLIMLGLCLNFKNIRRVWGTLVKNLNNPRTDQPAEHNTDVERRTIFFLLCVTVIFISLLANAGLSQMFPWQFFFDLPTTLRIIGLVAGYFIFQYAIYWTIGYAFSSDEGRTRWIEGFTASMTMLGISLLVPGLAVLFYPGITVVAVDIAAVLYVVARFLFIRKGFRIFYTNSASIVYFILYLCSLEIVPITILFYLAQSFCSL